MLRRTAMAATTVKRLRTTRAATTVKKLRTTLRRHLPL
jgi:hypothetical protein